MILIGACQSPLSSRSLRDLLYSYFSSMAPIIPGLIREAYSSGSRHTAGTPTLVKSDIDGKEVDFEWEATGSSVYSVTGKGSLVISAWENCKPKYDYAKFSVICSCPDGMRQHESNLRSLDRLYVCKHGVAALNSVCDPEAAKTIGANKATMVAEYKEKAKRQAEYLNDQRAEQEKQHPGERARIEYGLSKRSDAEIVKMVKDAAKTVDGLQSLVNIFPPTKMPAKQSIKCGRCKKTYDPRVKSDLICREGHPDDKVRTEWDGSKKSWSKCRRCDKTFGLDGFHSWGKRRRDDPEEEGDYCYESTHVPIDEFDEPSDPILNSLDDTDY